MNGIISPLYNARFKPDGFRLRCPICHRWKSRTGSGPFDATTLKRHISQVHSSAMLRLIDIRKDSSDGDDPIS